MVHKTIAGMLPDDWKGALIKQVCNVVRGSSPRPAGSPLYFNGDYLPWITVADVTNDKGMFLKSTKSKLTKEGAKCTRVTEPGTLLLTNSGATLGVPKISKIRSGANDGIAMLLDLKGIETKYAFYYLLSKTNYFREVVARGVGQPNLNTELIGSLPIPIPPLVVQKKITQILSAWDKAIAISEKLITNSQQQKKALMQQLLTGNKRFPEFKEDWKEFQLDEICQFKKGKGLSKTVILDDGKYKCILYGELYTKYGEVIGEVVSRTNETDSYKSVKGDVLIPSSTTTSGIDLANAVALLEDDVLLGGDINILRPVQMKICSEFLAYLLTHIKKYEIASRAQGITIIHLYGNDLKPLKVTLPCKDEQEKIASVIANVECEIVVLKKNLEYLKQEKKALMQQLLTGRRRVKIDEQQPVMA